MDSRNVAERPCIHYVPRDGSLNPQLSFTKFAYPGDEDVEKYRLVVIDIESGRLQEPNYGLVPGMVYGEEAFGFFSGKPMGWWAEDGNTVYFVDVDRGATAVRVVEFDVLSGNTRVLFEEVSNTFVKLNHTCMNIPMFLPLPETNELIWFSECSGYGHLYLYDMQSGKRKHPITGGQWLVRNVLHYDAALRELIIQTAARDKEINPYYRDICKINIDTGEIQNIASGCFEHYVYQPNDYIIGQRVVTGLDSKGVSGVSENGRYLVTTRSRVNTVPVSVLLDRDGSEILTLESADVSGLPSGWQWPEPVKLTADDNKTDIYGVVFRPADFSPDLRYPVIDFSCSYRFYALTPHGSFVNGPLFDYFYLWASSLAALGFIVVTIEGRGTPLRGKEFQDHGYGDFNSANDCADRIAGIRQLADRYPYMDLDRVGITGLDNCTNSVFSIFKHSDFYKVAVEHCFTDPRLTLSVLGEVYDAIPIGNQTNFNTSHAEECIDSFNGKLLLVDGMLNASTPAGTFRLVDALQKANKDFDMLCLPNGHHDLPTYAIRRTWDYLVKNLQGVEPPKEFKLTTSLDIIMETLNKS